jgi:hypothetical protein
MMIVLGVIFVMVWLVGMTIVACIMHDIITRQDWKDEEYFDD